MKELIKSPTKTQNILLFLRDNPDYRIYCPDYQSRKLLTLGKKRIQAISNRLFDSIRPWLKIDQSLSDYIIGAYFILDPEAELTPNWPAKQAEMSRQRYLAQKLVKKESKK